MLPKIISTKDKPIKRIGLYADPHLSQSSSIIVGRQGEFTGRLDNLIKSFEWMRNLFKEQNVDMIICLGDLTDRPDLTATEITALSKCNIDDDYLIIGNHCRSDKDGNINSLSIYNNILSSPQSLIEDEEGNCLVYILPYNSTCVDLSTLNHPKVILSHNDIKGYLLNGFIFKSGYEMTDIIDNCDLFINGHLHNGQWLVKDKICNLGMLSGSNFASCNGDWNPSAGILDLDTLHLEIYENPCAYKFRKIEFDSLPKIKNYLDSLNGEHYVIQIKVPNRLAENTRKLLNECKKIDASRVLTTIENINAKEVVDKGSLSVSSISVYSKLREFIGNQKKSNKFNLEIVNKIIDDLETNEGVE